MSELSIKVNIAGRIYPLTIKRNEEQAISESVDKELLSLQSFLNQELN